MIILIGFSNWMKKKKGYLFLSREDIYEETFVFENYIFTIGKTIPKIDSKYLSGYYVANFQSDLTNHDDCRVWNTIEGKPVQYYPVKLYPPNDYMKKRSEQLYNKYNEYYEAHK